MNIPKSFLENQVFQNELIGFDDRLPYRFNLEPGTNELRKAVDVQPDGTVNVSFYAPFATSVSVHNYVKSADLVRGDDNIWRGSLKYDEPGLKQIRFKVDGNEVLNDMAPIGYGWSKPINYVEIPDTECDFLLLKDVPHGTVSKEIYKSEITGQYEALLIYTPPGYQKSTESYPVLYLQHGGGENENSWVYQGRINYPMDNLLAEGKATPCIIAMGCGMTQVPDGKGGRAMDRDAFNKMLVAEIIPFVEENYRVKPGKWNRAFAGLSMGSLMVGDLVLNNFDVVGYAGLFTGYMYPNKPVEDFDETPFKDAEKFNSAYKVFFRAMGDQETSMPLFLHERKTLAKYGINTVERIYPGEHEWRVWRRASHDFLQLIFK